LTAVKFPLSNSLISKNQKLTLFKQFDFFNERKEFLFGSADALTHSSGNASMDAKAKAFEEINYYNLTTIFVISEDIK